MAKVLVAEDSSDIRTVLRRVLALDNHECIEVEDGAAALERCRGDRFDLILSDLRMPRLDGQGLLRELRAAGIGTPVIVLTAFADMPSTLEALRAGAFDYLSKPLVVEDLRQTIRRALEAGGGSTPEEPAVEDRWSLIGRSPTMVAVFKKMAQLMDSEAPVLIRGETGTGKELVARAMHAYGPRKDGPFVPVNCAALPDALIESELFGHSKGAFTGAETDRPGLIVAAHRGTLFLDEIGEIPAGLQAKLLRFLDDREVRRIGSTSGKTVDVRIVCATNRDLEASCQTGGFRPDLFYRIDAQSLALPPLRKRPGDVALLFRSFLQRGCVRRNRPIPTVDSDVLQRLESHSWPGNVRELQHVVDRAIAGLRGNRLRAEDFAFADAPAKPVQLRTLEEVEREHLLAVLKHVDGNRTEAARILGIDRKTLLRKLKSYRLDS